MKEHIDGVADSAKQGTHSRNSFQMNVQEGNTGARQWPFSLSDYGQAIIIELIKDNESLCERLPADIPKLFAMIAELSEYSKGVDMSANESLGFFLSFMKPGGRPEKKAQSFVAAIFTDAESFPRWHQSPMDCFECKRRGINSPERILRLLCAALEDGNNEAASMLSTSGVTLRNTCSSLVELKNTRTSGGEKSSKSFDAVALLMTPLGAALLKLSSELVVVRQLTSNELQDSAVKHFIVEVGDLAAEALGMMDSAINF